MIKIQFLVFVLLYFAAISSTRYNDYDSNKKVFAHVMIEFAYSVDENFFDDQIKTAKSAGIDGFVLNVGYNGREPERVFTALAAAAKNGNFTMFISFDMNGIPFNISVLSHFHFAASHPNYYKVNGRPFFSTFLGEYQDDFWRSWKVSSGLNPYFCPCWTRYPTLNLLQNHPVADCIFSWNAWPARNSGPGAHFNTTGDRNLLANAKATNKTYMAPLSP
jgi:glucan endo-1,3-alpha-glucosidase